MEYRLNDNNLQNRKNNITEIFFKNRGINDYKEYLELDETAILDWNCLEMIKEARNILVRHLEAGSKIGILIDEDVDGFCSGSMMLLYLENLCQSYGFDCKIIYILHTRAKAHGLSNDVTINDDIKLLIIPDAGTNDIAECNKLLRKNVDIIILDHHIKEDYVQNAKNKNEKNKRKLHFKEYLEYVEDNRIAIVNNQTSDNYTNKDLCGAGIVYQFLRCVDEEFPWNNVCADDYLDLCALANISDSMDMRSTETKTIVKYGLKNIDNNCFKSLCKSQDYSMNGHINMHNVQWFVTTIINGMIRFGSNDEKDLLFRAFIEKNETYQYKKRATKNKPAEVINESIYARAARLCKNAKSRQDRAKNKAVPDIVKMANEYCQNDKVAIINITDTLDPRLTGLVAIKVAEEINKPCVLLKQTTDYDTGKVYFRGSARNIDHCPIADLKTLLNSTKEFEYAQGHPNAFGVSIEENNVSNALNKLNHILEDTIYDSSYIVDFIFDKDELDVLLLKELCSFDDYIGNKIPEITFAVENIILTKNDINICGSKMNTLQFQINDIRCVMFNCNEDNCLYDFVMNDWNNDIVKFNAVCRSKVSHFNGIMQYEIIVIDLDIIDARKNENGLDEDDLDNDWN